MAPTMADADTAAETEAALADSSAERRKARKAARAAVPPPERDQAYDHLSLDELRSMKAELQAEETRVSYWRRIVQARLDLVESQGVDGGEPVVKLREVLADAAGSHRRIQHLSVGQFDDVPPLPDLSELWARQIDPGSKTKMAKLVKDLTAAEQKLSILRNELFRLVDGVTRELIARYREDPGLALAILPGDPMRLRT